RTGSLHDRWRIRRDGRLVHAEEARLSGALETLGGQAATLAGGRAFATLLAQLPDAEARLPAIRAWLPGRGGGASAFEGLIAVRIVADDGYALRKTLIPVLEVLADAPLPRLWSS
ncbi:MAG: urease accessory protein UreD, partial [Paracoccus sp.]|nr:urease accessory protein UreD [Paracoccus sp. (in: a-proteobacteria)]